MVRFISKEIKMERWKMFVIEKNIYDIVPTIIIDILFS